ncbi:CARDB domain-containing protein [Stieleria varia]|nr:CARDB domain-containing protein [Stieleria varia]
MHLNSRIQMEPGEILLHVSNVGSQTGTISNAHVYGTVTDTAPEVLQPCTTGRTLIPRTGNLSIGNFTGNDVVMGDDWGYQGTFTGNVVGDFESLTGDWSGTYGYLGCDYFDAGVGGYVEDFDIYYGTASGTWSSTGDWFGDLYNRSISQTAGQIQSGYEINDASLLVPVKMEAYWLDNQDNRLGKIHEWTVQSQGSDDHLVIQAGRAYSRPAGAAGILVVGDESQGHMESNESNNERTTDIKPFLIAQSIEQSADNENVSVLVETLNLLIADPVDVELFWTDAEGNRIGAAAPKQSIVPGVNRFTTVDFAASEMSLNRPADAAGLIAVVDDGNHYPEVNQEDNQVTLPLQAVITATSLQRPSPQSVVMRVDVDHLIAGETITSELYWTDSVGNPMLLAATKTITVGNDTTIDVMFSGNDFVAGRPVGGAGLLAIVDSDAAFAEADETDNEVFLALPGALTNLSASYSSFTQRVSILLNTQNLLAFEEIPLRLEWSNESEESLALAAEVSVIVGASGVINVELEPFELVNSRPFGATRLRVIADPGGGFGITLPPPFFFPVHPDLIAQSLAISDDFSTIQFHFQTENVLPTELVSIGLYWVDQSGTYLSQAGFTRVPAGGSQVSKEVVFDFAAMLETVPVGATNIAAWVDSEQRFLETLENNNRLAIPLPPAELSAVSPVDPDGTLGDPEPLSGAPGYEILVDWIIRNAGPGPAHPTEHSVHWSTDAVLDDSDSVITTFATDSIAAGAEQVVSDAALMIPEGTALGDYYLLVSVDHQDRVAETDEENNLIAVPVRLTDTSPYTNPVDAFDVNGDGMTTARDALDIINELLFRHASRGSDGRIYFRVLPVLDCDVNGDLRISALDALNVVNEIALRRRETNEAGEAERLEPGNAVAVDRIHRQSHDEDDDEDLQWYLEPSGIQ